jgi:hypothetical protein
VKQPKKTVGVYEAPRKAKWPRIVAAIFAVLIGIVVAIGFGSRFFGEARAGAMQENIPITWAPSWISA